MHLTGEKLPLTPSGKRSNPWRMLVYLVLIVGGIFITRMVEAGKVKPLLSPTPFPTRSAHSYTDEGNAYFSAGDMRKAIDAYQNAVGEEPENGRLWAELARIQTYSSELMTNYEARKEKLQGAIYSIDRAAGLSPDDSFVHAIRAFVYDWSAAAEEDLNQRSRLLNEAETSAVRANQLDPEDPLALAFYAEVLTDQQKWAQALDLAEQAVARAEANPSPLGNTLMDIYRVYGAVLEHLGLYRRAIEEYEKAAAISPNLTFLYLYIGVNYRQLRDFDTALEYFGRAAKINEQLTSNLSEQDPVPFIAIGRTYLQQGEFFAAALNMARALAINPADPDLYGQLGFVYYEARNYESAIPVLKCAVEGCSAEESQAILCELGYASCDGSASDSDIRGMDVNGLALGSGSLEYYYTYAAALAYYSGTEIAPSGCDQAESIHRELLAQYGSDDIVVGIINDNRAICSLASTPESERTSEPMPTETPES
jgi:tetratricopeptide (TPR) repeat protein